MVTSPSRLPRLLALALTASACDCEGDRPGDRCVTSADCTSGETCIDERCVPIPDGGGIDAGGSDGGDCPTARACRRGTTCCPEGQECVDDFQCLDVCPTVRCGDNSMLCCGDGEVCLDGVVCAADCADDQALCGADLDVCCDTGDVCLSDACETPGDSCEDDYDCLIEGDYCEHTIGRCLPIPSGIDCEVRPEFDRVRLEVEWHWPGVDIGGRLYENVLAQPVVGDISGDGIPDVVTPVYRGGDSADTILVALDGRTGALLWYVAGADRPDWTSSAGLANFDSTDEALEVVYRLHTGGYRIVDGDGTTELARRTTGSAAGRRGAPSIADLDADGTPDVVFGCHAMNGIDIGDASRDFFDLGACDPSGRTTLTLVANLDDDPEPEITSGGIAIDVDGSVLWDNGLHGFPAVADFDGDGRPEVVVVRSGTVVVRDGATGEMLIGPGGTWADGTYAIPGGGHGGPPTIADFDGDGWPEIASAGRSAYAVYDPDCLPTPPRAGAACGSTDFLRWQTATQDFSSSRTGSSVFDFQGDGVSEVVYNDECFLHVYNGDTGEDVLEMPLPNSSRTWIEYPLVVDVDRDGNSEIVLPANRDRAVARDNCPEAYSAAFGVPVADLPDAYRNGTSGIFVYGDPDDRWVRTRPIWNQHTYHVTNVGDRGEVPAVEMDNWLDPELNNYRQNVQGAGVFNAPNLQVSLSVAGACSERAIRLSALVRNVGSRGIPPGVTVTFHRTEPTPEEMVGSATTTTPLLPGGTERVTVLVEDIPTDVTLRYEVRVDGSTAEGGPITECNEDDNVDSGEEFCPGLG